MVPRGFLAGAACALAAVSFAGRAGAETPACAAITRSTVVPCALAASFAVRGERHAVEAARGRERAAAVILPSNPQLSLSAGARKASAGQSALNWSASLSQEVEIAGQRGARLDAARADTLAQSKRAALSQRDSAAAALTAYFDAIAAREELALADRHARLSAGLAGTANARAEQGLIAPIDADVAYAASVRGAQARAAAERRSVAALATLAVAVGIDPARPVHVDGDLAPLALPELALARLVERAEAERTEIAVALAEATAHERRASALRRARVPNVTLSVTVAGDGFNERVITGGLSLPIPLPGPLGRTNAGEIAEASGLARRAGADAQRLTRLVRLEVTTAAAAHASRRRELEAFDGKRLARAEASLRSLAEELAKGTLAVRDALLAQQALIELLQAHLEARRALCVASVELARAAGVALERGAP